MRVAIRCRAALVSVVAWSSSCTSLVTPPAVVDDPAVVYVIEEALHTGLVLPPTIAAAAERFVEFGFGDWGFYALSDDGCSGASAAVLWPTPGALGRRAFEAADGDELLRQVSWARLTPIVVDRSRVVALRRQLEHAFAVGGEQAVSSRDTGLQFVPSATSYWWPNTCADAAAAWLEQLGCDVAWCPLRIGLYVVTPDA